MILSNLLFKCQLSHCSVFSNRKMSSSACLDVRQLRFSVITFPAELNRHSDETLVATNEKNVCTILHILG